MKNVWLCALVLVLCVCHYGAALLPRVQLTFPQQHVWVSGIPWRETEYYQASKTREHQEPQEPRGAVSAFLGLQYGRVPARFSEPFPHLYHETELEAQSFGAACWQRGSALSTQFNANMSENCLFVNVWTPFTHEIAVEEEERVPVLVYIHGGNFLSGSGAVRTVNPISFVSRHRIILVTFNYRLGIFGFWRHAALTAAQPHAPTNLAFRDQQLALEWIRTHISSFGGNAAHVTVMGEDAGAISILTHLSSARQRTAPLFQKAILMSPTNVIPSVPSLADAYAIGNIWARASGCDLSADMAAATAPLECMRSVPAGALVSPLFRWSPLHNQWMESQYAFPVDEPTAFPSPFAAIQRGEFDIDCEILLGSALNESSHLLSLAFPWRHPSESLFREYLRIAFGQNHTSAIRGKYGTSEGHQATFSMWADIINDVRFQCPVLELAGHLGLHSTKTIRQYLFAFESRHSRSNLGVARGQELAYVFEQPSGILTLPAAFDKHEWLFSQEINQVWVEFIRGESRIPRWSHTSSRYLRIGDKNRSPTISIVEGIYKKAVCDWWKAYPEQTDSRKFDFEADSLWEHEDFFPALCNRFFWILMQQRPILINTLNVALIVTVLVFVARLILRGKNPFSFDTMLPKLKKE